MVARLPPSSVSRGLTSTVGVARAPAETSSATKTTPTTPIRSRDALSRPSSALADGAYFRTAVDCPVLLHSASTIAVVQRETHTILSSSSLMRTSHT